MRARDSETKSARTVCWLVAIDSQTGYIHVAPLGSKSPFRLIVQELMSLSQLLGYSAIAYRSDNESTTGRILKMLINAHHSLGLTFLSPAPFSAESSGGKPFKNQQLPDAQGHAGGHRMCEKSTGWAKVQTHDGL